MNKNSQKNNFKASEDLMEKVVSLAKRRGFIYPSFDIYGGLAGFFDYGPYGLALKNNITQAWWKQFVTDREDVYGLDSVIVTKKEVLQASGHISGFSDPTVECKKCKNIWRTDTIISSQLVEDGKFLCPKCRYVLGTEYELVAKTGQFNLMFQTSIGASKNDKEVSYLRPETAQGIFTNFKNIVDSFHPRLPFGIAQIGKAFRNEIAPRDFLFRVRELEQMEVEYFVRPPKADSRKGADGTRTHAEREEWEGAFEMWKSEMKKFIENVGIDAKKVSELEIADADRAHYSKRTIDFEYDFPFGRKELYGLAYRTDYDLKNHSAATGADLSYLDEETKEKIVPHVIEPSLGVGRTILAVLLSAYMEDEMNGEKRVFLKLKPAIAPVKVAVFPLLKNKPELVARARGVYAMLKKSALGGGVVVFDDNGNIGKRYRRQDEIGTITAVTIDFETLDNDTVTLRDRDSGKQIRVKISRLVEVISAIIEGESFSGFPTEIK